MTCKHLFICCDGTWNDMISTNTNVKKIYLLLKENFGEESTFYLPGVGMGEPLLLIQRILVGLTAPDISRKIKTAYKFIAQKYTPETKLWIFGFSRGAYTARSLVNLIYYAGIVKHDPSSSSSSSSTDTTAFDALITYAYEIFMHREDIQTNPGYKVNSLLPEDFRSLYSVPGSQKSVYFLGLWDTVGAIGFPKFIPDYGLRSNALNDQFVSPYITKIYHALAIHENMQMFEPTHVVTTNSETRLVELWFPGYHLDIGGGIGSNKIADETLRWMIDGMNKTDPTLLLGPYENSDLVIVIVDEILSYIYIVFRYLYKLFVACLSFLKISEILLFRDRKIQGNTNVLYRGGKDWTYNPLTKTGFANPNNYNSKSYDTFRDICILKQKYDTIAGIGSSNSETVVHDNDSSLSIPPPFINNSVKFSFNPFHVMPLSKNK